MVGADLTAVDAGLAFEGGCSLAVCNDVILVRRDGGAQVSPVGRRVSAVHEDADRFVIDFDSGLVLTVSLRDHRSTGPEAMVLHGPRIVVWQAGV